MPTVDGVNKLYTEIRGIDKTISSLIENAEKTGQKMDIADLFKEFDALESDAILSAKPLSKVSAMNNVKKQIKVANKAIGRKDFTPEQAQKLKQNIYKDIKEYYDKQLKLPMSVKAQKSVAKQAKLFLEEMIPEIKALNKKDADYISLMEALDRPVSRIANRDIIGIGAPIKAGTGGAVGAAFGVPEIGIAIGTGLAVLDHPLVKARLAILLNKLEQQGIKISAESRAALRTAIGTTGEDEGETDE
jgi:hypothetical protein